MTDLKNKTVEELREWAQAESICSEGSLSLPWVEAFDEVARRLEEAQQKLAHYTRRSESGESLFDHFDALGALEEAQKQIIAQQAHIKELFDAVASGKSIFEVATYPLESLAAHDAEVTAKTLEKIIPLAKYLHDSLVGGAAEYRTKAKREE